MCVSRACELQVGCMVTSGLGYGSLAKSTPRADKPSVSGPGWLNSGGTLGVSVTCLFTLVADVAIFTPRVEDTCSIVVFVAHVGVPAQRLPRILAQWPVYVTGDHFYTFSTTRLLCMLTLLVMAPCAEGEAL